MSFIDKFKYNYSRKILNSHLKDKNYQGLFMEINKYANSKNIALLELLNENLEIILNDLNTERFYPKNLIWLNAFDHEDSLPIVKFLEYYFIHKPMKNKTSTINKYENLLVSALENFSDSINLGLNDLLNNSYLYQLLISLYQKDSIIFLQNNIAFFEYNNLKRFTHPFLTNCYIYIVKNPYQKYKELKKNNLSSQEAQNLLLNLDQGINSIELKETNKTSKVEILKKSWSTNLSSWDNENVKNSFNGVIIKWEDLVSEPVDQYASIISHLIQAGLEIDLDYDLVNNFSKNNTLSIDNSQVDISNKELKAINRDIFDKANQYFYN